jgi:hypothetical protein
MYVDCKFLGETPLTAPLIRFSYASQTNITNCLFSGLTTSVTNQQLITSSNTYVIPLAFRGCTFIDCVGSSLLFLNVIFCLLFGMVMYSFFYIDCYNCFCLGGTSTSLYGAGIYIYVSSSSYLLLYVCI